MATTHLFRPSTVAEAVSLLADDDGARCLAGGATLVAMMNARLVAPCALVSLAAIDELAGVTVMSDGTLRIGAMTRHYETAGERRLAHGAAVLRMAAGQIANPVVRNMGTIGGSIAFADPAADYAPALVAAGAAVELTGNAGRRIIPISAFFTDWYATDLAPGELVTAVLVPAAPRSSVGRFLKLARVSGDFAIASVALYLAVEDGQISTLRVAVGGCGPVPVRAPDAERHAAGRPVGELDSRMLGDALAARLDPVDDVRASATYRRLVVPRLVQQALAEAVGELGSG